MAALTGAAGRWFDRIRVSRMANASRLTRQMLRLSTGLETGSQNETIIFHSKLLLP